MMLSLSMKHVGLETGPCFHKSCIHDSCVIVAMLIQQVYDGVNILSQKKKKRKTNLSIKNYYSECDYNLYKLKIKLSSSKMISASTPTSAADANQSLSNLVAQ